MVATATARSKPKPAQRLPKPTSKPVTSKPAAYKPRITFLSATEYLVPSERYGGHVLYLVTVLATGRAQCECDGYKYRRSCKHSSLALAMHAYRQNPCHLRPAPSEGAVTAQSTVWASLVAEVAALPVATFSFRTEATTPPAFIPAPPAFAELFAA